MSTSLCSLLSEIDFILFFNFGCLEFCSCFIPRVLFFPLHFKRWHVTGPVWSHRWCELWGWSLEPLFSDFSHSLSHPSGSETLWDLPFLLTIKKKSPISWYIFGCKNNSRWYVLYRKKTTEFFTLSPWIIFQLSILMKLLILQRTHSVERLSTEQTHLYTAFNFTAKIKRIVTLASLHHLLLFYIFNTRY